MPSIFDSSSFDRAFAPMTEPVVWRQDRAPHRRGSFGAVVTRGQVETASAGNAVEPLLADAWSVRVSRSTALVADVRVGDTISRLGRDAEVLTVQQISRDDSGWLLVCTAEERSPKS